MISNDDGTLARPAADQPRRRRVAALLLTTTPRAVAAVALAAAPLAIALPVAATSGAPHSSATLHAGECNTVVPFGGLSTPKWPDCAGD